MLIIISSLGFVIHLFHPLLMSLATLILPKKFGTCLLLGMLDRVVLATSRLQTARDGFSGDLLHTGVIVSTSSTSK